MGTLVRTSVAIAVLVSPAACRQERQQAPTPDQHVAPPASSAPQTPSLPQSAEPSSPPTEPERIETLLDALANSEAMFIRNGVEYSGRDAASHLRRKWRAAGDQIATLNAFIDHLASRSSETGRPYLVRTPDGRIVESAEWMRSTAAADTSTPTPKPTATEPAIRADPIRGPADVLAIIETSRESFLTVEDDEIESRTGRGMAARLRFKWAFAGKPDLPPRKFVEQFCTRSSLHGTEYVVKRTDGSTAKLGDWLLSQLAEAP
ncbi:MAG TPA: DUF5329 family protein [Phycisphaerales bacterium]|nr:DUF5329 family protein [Phycisphaerales bacterium]